ncbi:MAG TPA: HAD-IC family P-type ATPase [Steroidobacteraceae bacterium]|nr:HAD-IC family P-type ATPase [Steroidobacteraceae bacterium]
MQTTPLASTQSASPLGLTSEEARRRLADDGPNAVADAEPQRWRAALAKFWAPVPWLLELAIVLQLALREYVEAFIIALLLLFNALLGLMQEGRAQNTLAALRSRLALRAVVRRDGAWQVLPASELVVGDVVKLTLGSIVPADVRLIAGDALLDQSMLTGESLPVEGTAATNTYAGSLVRRGEALAQVTATGARTKSGQTAQLVSIAHGASSQQRAVLRVVRNLAVFSGSMVALQLLYAMVTHIPGVETIPLVLTAVLAAIPVALPATFTLASALAARALAAEGVLPTRLSAIDEAASVDVLCSDKTGTLTENALTVSAVYAAPGADEQRVLRLALLASADAGTDPLDAAVRAAAVELAPEQQLHRTRFVPFDPVQKMSQASATDMQGQQLLIVKGAVARIAELATIPADIASAVTSFAARGDRVLGVAAGLPGQLEWIGLIAVSDPPRADAAELIAELGHLGVRTVMITGDAAATAGVVAHAVGLYGPVHASGPIPARLEPGEYAVFAGVFPEDKFHIVRAYQRSGHTLGMCGDGANDAPALRQAQMGIAVTTATDIAKSAAGLVLTQPGLGGIVAAVRAGRRVYQRMLTYALRSLTAKITQMLFLTAGLILTGHAILTPMLMVILVITGDFLAMSATTDRVRASGQPNAWRIREVTFTAVALGLCNVAFCLAVLAFGRFQLGLLPGHGLRTLAAVTLVMSTQATFYVVRERRQLWSSRPSIWVMLSSIVDILIITLLAGFGILMHALSWDVIGAVLGASMVFAVLLDSIKSLLARHQQLT